MAPKGKKSGKKKKSGSGSQQTPLLGVRSFLWTAAFAVTLLALVAILFLPHKDRPKTASQPPQDTVSTPRAATAPELPAPRTGTPRPFVYEERIGADFDIRVWEADMAILQTLSLMGHEADRMVHKKVETRFFYGTPYHFQEIIVYTSNAREEFITKLKSSLDRFLSNVSLDQTKDESTWAISINGQPTHVITLERIIERPLPGTGRLAIIIDDLGGSIEYARNLHRLGFPVIFSILPHMPATSQVVHFARSKDIEVMLHMPMEPLGYPQGIEPGPGALFVDMDSGEIHRRVLENLAQVPGAIGVNNHMGSRFTQDTKGMSIVFDELKNQGLFFVDSLTTPGSVAEELAGKKGLDFLKRHVFIDNVQDKKAIMFQLSKAENLAIKNGMAVAIGHPYPETMEALREWNRIRNQNVQVVNISELISARRYNTATRYSSGSLN